MKPLVNLQARGSRATRIGWRGAQPTRTMIHKVTTCI